MGSQQVTSLHFAVRSRVLCKYGGQLLLVFAILTAVILLFALLVGEYHLAGDYGVVVVVTGTAGYLLQRLQAPTNLQENESLVLTAAIFIIAPLLVTIPLQQSGLPLSDALFEAISGITTTGLTTLASMENPPKTFYFARSWLQWIGGLGILVLSVALLLPRTTTFHLFEDIREREDLVTGAKAYARIVLKIYLLLTGAGIIALLLLGVNWLDAVTHVLAAVSTGGFSTHDNSLAGLAAWPSRVMVLVCCCLGAVSLGLYYQAFQKGWRTFVDNTEVSGLLIAGIAVSVLIIFLLILLDGYSVQEALLHGPLLAFSAQTTAGFSTVTVAGLAAGTKLILILAMLVGGCVGSTAGGVKITRLLIALNLLRLAVVHSGLASGAVVQPRYMGRRLEQPEIERCFLILFLFPTIIVLSWLPFVMLGYPPLDALFEVVSATGTVGLSTGISSAGLPVGLKTVLCLDMLMGRLEIIAFLVLVYPPTWIGKTRGETS